MAMHGIYGQLLGSYAQACGQICGQYGLLTECDIRNMFCFGASSEMGIANVGRCRGIRDWDEGREDGKLEREDQERREMRTSKKQQNQFNAARRGSRKHQQKDREPTRCRLQDRYFNPPNALTISFSQLTAQSEWPAVYEEYERQMAIIQKMGGRKQQRPSHCEDEEEEEKEVEDGLDSLRTSKKNRENQVFGINVFGQGATLGKFQTSNGKIMDAPRKPRLHSKINKLYLPIAPKQTQTPPIKQLAKHFHSLSEQSNTVLSI